MAYRNLYRFIPYTTNTALKVLATAEDGLITMNELINYEWILSDLVDSPVQEVEVLEALKRVMRLLPLDPKNDTKRQIAMTFTERNKDAEAIEILHWYFKNAEEKYRRAVAALNLIIQLGEYFSEAEQAVIRISTESPEYTLEVLRFLRIDKNTAIVTDKILNAIEDFIQTFSQREKAEPDCKFGKLINHEQRS